MDDPEQIAAGLSEALCPHFEDHTPSPSGYLQWHMWAKQMNRTHRVERCHGCGLYTIWTPRRTLISKETDNDGYSLARTAHRTG